MFSLFKKKKQVEPIDDRREAIEDSRKSSAPTAPEVDDRRQAIEQFREGQKPAKKATPKKATPKKKK